MPEKETGDGDSPASLPAQTGISRVDIDFFCASSGSFSLPLSRRFRRQL